MGVLRRQLPRGVVGAIFYPKTIMVDEDVSEAHVLMVVALAVGRCRGLFAVVSRADLDDVLAIAARGAAALAVFALT